MKSDKVTVYKRVQEIYKLMCEGVGTVDIVQYGADNWQIKQRGMYKLIKLAMIYFQRHVDKNIKDLRFEANIRFDKLYEKLFKQEKYSEAGRIQAYKNKINGLEVQKIDVEHNLKGDLLNKFASLFFEDKD